MTESKNGIGDINSDAVGSGARYNVGKVRYELIPTHLLESTARVFTYGANKYAAWNWVKGMKFSAVIGCVKRHLAAIERGEDYDAESGERHVGHLMCNLLMLEQYMNMIENDPSLKEELDDRPTKWFAKPNKDLPSSQFPTLLVEDEGRVEELAEEIVSYGGSDDDECNCDMCKNRYGLDSIDEGVVEEAAEEQQELRDVYVEWVEFNLKDQI